MASSTKTMSKIKKIAFKGESETKSKFDNISHMDKKENRDWNINISMNTTLNNPKII